MFVDGKKESEEKIVELYHSQFLYSSLIMRWRIHKKLQQCSETKVAIPGIIAYSKIRPEIKSLSISKNVEEINAEEI